MQDAAVSSSGTTGQCGKTPSSPPPSSLPNQERSGERVVHVKGAGAFGYFEVTHDISRWSRAHVFGAVGRRTPVLLRCSVAGTTSHEPDTVREVRGFAVRHYTEHGLWDMVGHDTPVYFVKDPGVFPSLVHSLHRDPHTLEKNADRFWDFVSLRPETMHQVCILFGARGLPDGYRHMNGYSSHAFRLNDQHGGHVYAKFHYKTDQGVQTLSPTRAEQLAVSNPDYAIEDMKRALADGQPTSWTLYIQVMTPAEAAALAWDPFDVTRVWPQAQFAPRPVGRLVVLSDPADRCIDLEQVAFSPANMPDGIAASADLMLQARLFSYEDTQYHHADAQATAEEDSGHVTAAGDSGHAGLSSETDRQQLHATAATSTSPNALAEPLLDHDQASPDRELDPEPDPELKPDADDHFSQPRTFWKNVLSEEGRQDLVKNIALDVCKAKVSMQARVVHICALVSTDFGQRILRALLMYNLPDDAEELQNSL